MRIVFMGSGEFGVPSLNQLVETDFDLCRVITAPARPAGRGQKLRPTPIAQQAEKLSLPCVETDNVNDPAMIEQMKHLSPQAIIVIAFGQKIGSELLQLPNCRIMNLHASLLPKYRGAAPINWAVINGEKETGVTIFEINQGWDTGAILGQSTTPIGPTDTAGDLHDRLALLGPDLWLSVLEKIQKRTIQPQKQDDTLACKAPKLTKADGAIQWSLDATVVRNRIHGLWPWPGAYATLARQQSNRKEKITVARVNIIDEPVPAGFTPGTLDNHLHIQCRSGKLQILELKPAGGKLMSFADFANGRRLEPDDRFLDGEIS